ncbi:MAG: nickel pincer cofactor biosynthesis protein LarC [Erysipelotrichaceae bacterium]|nr:nickel pincer cofactor biosynthesis protein LarC [Erysipelotrichaceae bacterium]
MKTLYFDCYMGAAGDMLTGALLELQDDPEQCLKELNELGIPGVEFQKETSEKCGIQGTHMHVLVNGEEEVFHHHHHDHEHDDHEHDHEHHHHHSGMHDIEHIVRGHMNISDELKDRIMHVYSLIAEAESHAHGMPVEQIHFHEVGTMDAVADVTAVCYLIDKLNVDKIIASPIHVGRGTVRCAHGILPVPAPATAYILRDVPIYSKENIEGELCTPTGAALLKTYVSEFKTMPTMAVKKVGYGMGTKDFPVANCVRAILGETDEGCSGVVRELDFNVDDMTGEEIGFLMDTLLKKGAFEVFVTPVYMKKNRPGNLISVLCSADNEEEMVELIFRHSTTIGIRKTVKDRYILNRKIEEVDTKFGTIRRKVSSGYGVDRRKYECDDLMKVAEEKGLSIKEIIERLNNE